MKMDAKFYGEIKKVKDDSIVPEDQYVVFLAKDNAFFSTVPYYMLQCMQFGCDQEHLEAVLRMYLRMRKWRLDNPGKLKTPDAAGEKLLDVTVE